MNFYKINLVSRSIQNFNLFRFYKRDTSTIIQVRNTSDPEVPFIAFTVCPDYHSAYKKDVVSKYNISVEDYRHRAIWYPNETDPNFNAKAFFHEITHEIHEIIEKIEISTMSMNTPKVVVEILKELGQKYVEFTTQYENTYNTFFHFGMVAFKQIKRSMHETWTNNINHKMCIIDYTV